MWYLSELSSPQLAGIATGGSHFGPRHARTTMSLLGFDGSSGGLD